jgi:D-sedoheptulose 7-phosphate isomerase
MHKRLFELVQKRPELAICSMKIQKTYDLLSAVYQNGGKLLVCGNGGSAADAEHIVGELMKGFWHTRPLDNGERKRMIEISEQDGEYLANHLQGALPAISLVSQTSLITAFANDVDPDLIYAQQVYGYGVAGDALLGISTSGKARNVLYAMQTAKALGMKTIALTGKDSAKLADFADVCINVPAADTPSVQEMHITVYHSLCTMLEEEFFEK